MSPLKPLVVLFVVCAALWVSPVDARMSLRQGSTAVSSPTSSMTTVQALQKIVLPAIQSLVAAPLKLIQELIREIRHFLRTHNFREMLDVQFLRESFQRFPERIATYWSTFTDMEFHCIRRTMCDLADYTSHRVPAWFNQILVIYFSTFSQNNAYFQSVTNGLVTHNCHLVYTECEPKAFLNRISGNVSNTIATTVAPIKEAIDELVHVTASTLDSIGDTLPVTPPSTALESNLPSGLEIEDERTDLTADEMNERSFSRLPSNQPDEMSNMVELRQPPPHHHMQPALIPHRPMHMMPVHPPAHFRAANRPVN